MSDEDDDGGIRCGICGYDIGQADVMAAGRKGIVHVSCVMAEVQRPLGCICPPGAEKTCQGLNCPRRAVTFR